MIRKFDKCHANTIFNLQSDNAATPTTQNGSVLHSSNPSSFGSDFANSAPECRRRFMLSWQARTLLSLQTIRQHSPFRNPTLVSILLRSKFLKYSTVVIAATLFFNTSALGPIRRNTLFYFIVHFNTIILFDFPRKESAMESKSEIRDEKVLNEHVAPRKSHDGSADKAADIKIDGKSAPTTATTMMTDGGTEHSDSEPEPEYIAGFKLVLVMGAITLVIFLMLLDMSIIVTVIMSIIHHC